MFKLRSLPDMLPDLDLQQPYDSSSDARIIKREEFHL
jgi:hypothetical protein